jgi:hypothetical protein
MSKLDGSCMCGAVTYTSDAEPVMTAICHCTDCQKQGGAAFSINVGIPRDSLRIEGDSLATHITIGTDHKMPTKRQFCSKCGSPIVSLPDPMPDLAFIKAGTLNDRSWLQPTLQVWSDSAQPWVSLETLAEMALPRGPG